jgi:L-threonylcarbamoyladenylate synthase
MTDVLPVNDRSLSLAAKILKEGGVVVIPTDTVYGLICHAMSPKAVSRVRDIKVRDREKPLQIEVGPDFVERYAFIDETAAKVIKAFWPGALSIVVKKKPTVPEYVSADDTICLSCQANRVSRRISALFGKPFITTSANVAGEKAPKSITDVSESVLEAVDLALDDGPTKYGVPNTILDLTVKPPRILRDGPVKKNQIKEIIEVA